MLIFLMRHGIAAERDPARYPDDDLRPLTPQGKRRTTAVARGMAGMGLGITRILTSPLVRAEQTARIVCGALGLSSDSLLASAALHPDQAAAAIVPELASAASDPGVLLVGHEPHLSFLTSWLLTGAENGLRLTFKKAGLACVECARVPSGGSAVLQFFMKPGQVAAFAG